VHGPETALLCARGAEAEGAVQQPERTEAEMQLSDNQPNSRIVSPADPSSVGSLLEMTRGICVQDLPGGVILA
jgi:hypothetical protein